MAPSIWGILGCLSSVTVVADTFTTLSRPPDGAESGLALTGELISSAQDLPEAGWKAGVVAFIPGLFVVDSSGFVTRSANELLVAAAAAAGVLSLGRDIIKAESDFSDQVVNNQQKVGLYHVSQQRMLLFTKDEGRRAQLVVFQSRWFWWS